MIVVTGSIVAAPGKLAAVLEQSLAHVRRSRAEPGCLEHGVAIDAENPNRLVFFERWKDMEALQAHFAVPASAAFVKEAAALAAAPPKLEIYDAERVAQGRR